jgi:PAS domain S-box-containing protein
MRRSLTARMFAGGGLAAGVVACAFVALLAGLSDVRGSTDAARAAERRAAAAAEEAAVLKARSGPAATDAARRLRAVAASERRAAARADARADRGWRTLHAAGIAALFASTALIIVFAAYLAGAVVAPLRRLSTAAARLAAGDLASRVAVSGPTEVATLAAGFNDMAATLERTLADLRAGDERFRAVLDANLDALLVLDPVRDADGATRDFAFAHANRPAETFFGRPAADLIGRRLGAVAPGLAALGVIERYATVAATRQTIEEELETPGDDGAVRWLYQHIAPLGDGVTVALRDVTGRKRTEQELARVASDIATVAEVGHTLPNTANAAVARAEICRAARTVADGAVALLLEPDGDGGLVTTAEAGAAGALPAPRLDDPESVAARVFATQEPAYAADLASAPAVAERELGGALGDGSALWQPVVRNGLSVGVLVVAWAADAPRLSDRAATILALFTNEAAVAIERADFLAQLEELNRRLALQVEALRVSDQLKSDFVSSVSHELRTPLTAILGYLSILTEGAVEGEEQQEFLGIIDANARRLLSLINDLLTLAGLESGRMIMRAEPVDLREVVAEHARDHDPALRGKRLRLALDLPAAPVGVRVDRERFGQVLANLLSNAVKFTPESGLVTVQVSANDGSASVSVRDTGIGIPADEADRLFDRFFRARNATDRAIPGTGLGLAISKAIVDAHRGDIAVDTALERGTAVTVTLPRVAPEAPALAA